MNMNRLWIAAAVALPGAAAWADDISALNDVTPIQIEEDTLAVMDRQPPFEWSMAISSLDEDNTEAPPWYEGIINTDLDNADDSLRLFGNGFDSFYGNFLFPTEPTVAAGPAHIVTATNEGIRFHSKTGAQQFTSSVGNFFSTVKVGWDFTLQPSVIYDAQSSRFILVVPALRSTDTYSWFLIAVSDDSNPNGTWKKWAIDSTKNGTAASGNWSDWVRLGVDQNTLVVSANMFSRSNYSFQYSKLRAFDKSKLVGFATTITYTDFWNISNPDGSKAFSITPAEHATSDAPAAAVFGVNTQTVGKCNMFAMIGALTQSPTLDKVSMNTGSYTKPPFAKQRGCTTTLDCGDGRVNNAVFRNGVLTFAHSVEKQGVTAIRWYQMAANAWPTVTMGPWGTVFEPGVYQWHPSIAVNAAGTVAMGFTQSSQNSFVGHAFCTRTVDDPPNAMDTPVIARLGARSYLGEGGTPVRWGDYTTTVVDPVNTDVFWTYGAYPNSVWGGTWNTWVQPFSDGQFCPADFDANGFVNGDDFDAFVVAFETGESAADVNRDGFVNGDDFDGYVIEFESGC